jgi:type IV secretion system protein VirB10
MSPKDRLLETFPALRRVLPGSKGSDAPVVDDGAAPGGLDIKPDAGKNVVGLNKNIIIVAGVVLAGAAGAVYYGLSHVHPTMPSPTDELHIKLPNRSNVQLPPVPPAPPAAPQSSPVAAKKPAPAASAPVRSASSAEKPAPAPAAAPAPQATPQQQAVVAALSGQNSGGSGGWGGNQTARRPDSDQPAHDTATAPIGSGGLRTTPTAINAVNDQSGLGVYNTHLVRKPASPYEVMQGSVIPATLTTGIESDLPGQITAIVSRNVYDSASGAHLLIPAGAQLVGQYATQVLPGQQSVAVAWTRIVFPNGSYINLGTMPGTDPNGMSGLSGDVDNHTWLMFKNALLLSLVSTGMAEAQPQTTTVNGQVSSAQLFTQQFAQTFGQAVAQVLQRYSQIAPTIHVQPGAQLAVVVSKDLVFPGPYTTAMQAGKQDVRDAAYPAMVNPYPKRGEE